ncbi:MAG TPA: 50S ribosomal protein L9 [Cryomorphaceae bacterium]|nr:50S ribosomal protein L9 [Cryomorphaceae bacterium]
MQVILKQDIEKLGYKDDLVEVKPGYARNYLIPRGMAILATPTERKILEENIRQRTHKEEKIREEALEMAKKLTKEKIKIGAKVGEKGKIFGSVNTIQVADALEAIGVKVDRKHITIKGDAIKQIGVYQAEVRLHKSVVETIDFEVVGE